MIFYAGLLIAGLLQGVMISLNGQLGKYYSLFGITLFVTSPIAGVKLEETVKEAIPFLVVTIGSLLLVTFVPDICLFLPRLTGDA